MVFIFLGDWFLFFSDFTHFVCLISQKYYTVLFMVIQSIISMMPGLKETAAEKLKGFMQIKKPSSMEEGLKHIAEN